MQEDTVRVVSEKTRVAERWNTEAARLFDAHSSARQEADELRLQHMQANEDRERLQVDNGRL
jgi:hypothetical protein